MSRISSSSQGPVNKPSSSRPQSTEQDSPSGQPKAENASNNYSSHDSSSRGSENSDSGRSSSAEYPSRSEDRSSSGDQITGGVDSKTQFEATQNLRNNKSTYKAEHAGPGATTKADGNIPDAQDENGKTAEQENTTGPAAKVSQDEINKAAGGNQQIADLLTKLDTDVEGHKELRLALDKGTTYKMGSLPGSEVGVTQTGSSPPVVTLDSDNNDGLNIDTVAHETAHAAYQDMSHAEVYRLGHRVESRVNGGQTRDASNDPASTPKQPTSSGNGNGNGAGSPGGGSAGGAGGSSGGGSAGGAGESSGGGSAGGAGGSSGGGSAGGAGGSSGGGSAGGANPNANNTGKNTTIDKLPDPGNITDAQLSEIAGGDPQVIEALKIMLKDPQGKKLVGMIIQKHGKIVDDESLGGGAVGLAPVGGENPTIKIKKSALKSPGDIAKVLFHEATHVSGDPGDSNHDSGNDGKDSVYNAEDAFAQRMGLK